MSQAEEVGVKLQELIETGLQISVYKFVDKVEVTVYSRNEHFHYQGKNLIQALSKASKIHVSKNHSG